MRRYPVSPARAANSPARRYPDTIVSRQPGAGIPPPAGTTPATAIITEGGDFIVTEGGDYIVTEV